MKKCSKCGERKEIVEFYKDKTQKHGLTSACKMCARETGKRSHFKNRDKVLKRQKKWRIKNSDKEKNRTKKWREENKEVFKETARKWRIQNKELTKKTIKKWQAKNPHKVKSINKRAYQKVRSTLKGKLNSNLRSVIRQSLQGGSKAGRHWENLVDYTIDELKCHLEKKFLPGMTWENYGKHGWHIDHKIPISAFNFEKPEHIDFKKCWALKNLNPLWAKDNKSKSNKLNQPFQPSLKIGLK